MGEGGGEEKRGIDRGRRGEREEECGGKKRGWKRVRGTSGLLLYQVDVICTCRSLYTGPKGQGFSV